MHNSGAGDRLASGNQKSANFAGGIGESPLLRSIAKEIPESTGFVVTDKRHSFLDSVMPEAIATVDPYAGVAAVEYEPLRPILDRLLIKRVVVDKEEELLSDGSTKNRKTGLITPAKQRQHANTGIVLAMGDFVVMGGVKTPLSDFVKPGDRVTYGDYNTEIFKQSEEVTKAMCEAIGMPYFVDDGGLRIVRVQDVRGIERPIPTGTNKEYKEFVTSYYDTSMSPPETLRVATLEEMEEMRERDYAYLNSGTHTTPTVSFDNIGIKSFIKASENAIKNFKVPNE